MDFEKIYLDQNEFIEEVLLCNYPHLSIQDIQEMDIENYEKINK